MDRCEGLVAAIFIVAGALVYYAIYCVVTVHWWMWKGVCAEERH
jgi:hypothetical protein